jgi:hypothetical protein
VTLAGSFIALQLFDVSEAIRLDELRQILGLEAGGRGPAFRQPSPEYVRFERPPVRLPIDDVEPVAGERFRAEIHYYDYGVACLLLERKFACGWDDLARLAARWVPAPQIEAAARERVRLHLGTVRSAVVKPSQPHLNEDYAIVRVDPIKEGDREFTAQEVLERHGRDIARIVRGEEALFAREEQAEILSSRLSYYPSDLLVAGWQAAFVYDTAEGAEPTVQLFEYANTQLLEFRFYDEVLTKTLAEVYRLLDEGTGILRRWTLAREAQRLNTIRLDVRELAERSDNAIKFLSDMFAARLYRLAAAKVGVPDYRRLVEDKLKTAGDLYHFMTERFHQSSALLLESTIVLILIIDLFFLFRGKS